MTTKKQVRVRKLANNGDTKAREVAAKYLAYTWAVAAYSRYLLDGWSEKKIEREAVLFSRQAQNISRFSKGATKLLSALGRLPARRGKGRK